MMKIMMMMIMITMITLTMITRRRMSLMTMMMPRSNCGDDHKDDDDIADYDGPAG